MKNLIFGATVLASGLLAASAPAATCARPGTPDANIALVKNFYAAINDSNKSLFDVALAPDWVDVPLAPKQPPGREGMKGALDFYKSVFPDFHARNEDFIATNENVVVRSTLTATQKGDFAGIKATGKPITLMAVDIHQICDGKITQTWHVEDWLSALFQLGALPPKS